MTENHHDLGKNTENTMIPFMLHPPYWINLNKMGDNREWDVKISWCPSKYMAYTQFLVMEMRFIVKKVSKPENMGPYIKYMHTA